MFDRYTERARRAIFFARYEASQFGSSCIETEHLLLGLLREDKALVNRFVGSHAIESIRGQIEAHSAVREKVSTSVDLPLSRESMRVLTYAAEETARLNHEHIGTPHLLLALIREERAFAAQLLRKQGLTSDWVRKEVQQAEAPPTQSGAGWVAALDLWLAECEARGDIWTASQERAVNGSTHFAIYAGDSAKGNEEGDDGDPARKLLQLQRRIYSIVARMENAIANHQFETARFYSDEERKARENLRQLLEQSGVSRLPPPDPLLCIKIIRDDRFSDVQGRCDRLTMDGVAQVWILDPNYKRAYTFTEAEGLREFKGSILQIANPPLEMDLKKIFVEDGGRSRDDAS